MLIELQIRDFAIIDQLTIQFNAGFNVMTGETGAGKSIILDAMTLILGGRAETSMVRAGAEKALLEATFQLDETLRASVNPILEREGLDDETPDTLVLGRELRTTGRFLCRINGRAVTLSLLRQVAAGLIDIHGQGEHLSLLKPRSHLPLLDAYGNLESQRDALGREVKQLSAIRRELTELRASEQLRAQRQDFLNFRVEEISTAQLQPDEDVALQQERTRLANSEQLMQLVVSISGLLLGDGDDENSNALDLLNQAERQLVQLGRLDESQAPLLARLQGLASEINELAADVDDYRETLEFNPDRLTEVEERLDLINRLKRKYGASVAAILQAEQEAVAELASLTGSEARIGELEQLEKRYLTKIGKLGAALSRKRKSAATTLAKAVVAELKDLRMDGARFSVDFQLVDDANGVALDEQRVAFDETGVDKLEFLISTNPGEPVKPMAKVASGGETARLMLALKTALARVDATPTLIFDEIDQGIGGRIGAIVGEKLWGLSAEGSHQVIVVTHLPQLAGYGDMHFHVSKRLNAGRTTSSVQILAQDDRVRELAAMLGTQAEHAQAGARAILADAATAKKRREPAGASQ